MTRAAAVAARAVAPSPDGLRAYEGLLQASERWREYVEGLTAGGLDGPHLAVDLFFSLYEDEVRLNPDVPPGWHRNFAAVAALLPLAAFAALRRETRGDATAAALAARRLTDDLLAAAEAEEQRRRRRFRGSRLGLFFRRTANDAPHVSSPPATASASAPSYSAVQAAARAAEEARRDRRVRATWGIAPGLRGAHGLDDVWRLVDLVRNLPDFEQLTDAFADMSTWLRAAAKGPSRRRLRRAEEGRFEALLGLTRGRDLERVVPEEMVRLLDDDLTDLFHEAFEHGRLLQERYGSKPPEAPGPLAVCLDASRSMNGPAAQGRERFVWAKGIGLALLDGARRQGRDFLGLCFSSEEELAAFDVPAGGYRPEVAVELARCDFDGGTHFQAPLRAAAHYLARRRAASSAGSGHIVFVTDGEAALPGPFVEQFARARRRLGFRLVTVFIDGRHDGLAALSDRVFVVRGERFASWEGAAAGLARTLAEPR